MARTARFVALPLSLSLVVVACANACADQVSDVAFQRVLTNTARLGYEAAVVCYDAETIGLDQLLLWSKRLFDVETGRIMIRATDRSAAQAQVNRLEKLRRKVNVSNDFEAAQTDFAYQVAIAALAASDKQAPSSWHADIFDLSRLQGEWIDDRKRRAAKTGAPKKDIALKIVGGMATLSDGVGETDGFVDLDASKTPKEITFFGRNADYFPTTKGIYELNGDELRLACRRGNDEPARPATFEIREKSDFVVYTFRREKPKPTPK